MKKSLMITGLVVLALAASGYFFVWRGGSKKYEFRFDQVSTGDISVYVTATGTINAVTSVDVGTQVSGIISKLYADFNSVVKEGQIIAQIDPTFLQQAVKDAEANMDKVKAQFADSKRVLDRTKALYEKSLESQMNYDAAVTTFESNQATLKQAQASLDRAKINLAYATIYAPINGVVIDRKVNVGQTVAASFSSPTLFTIANDLRKMQVQTTVDESDIGRISIGEEATFTVDAYPDERFSGTVAQIRLAPVTVQNVVNYTVVINVDNEQLKLMPGMTANVRILVVSTSGVLRVPNMALRLQPPAEIVDSTKVQGQGRPGEPGSDRRARFEAVKDSIQKAHGGNLSSDELRAEVGKLFGGSRGKRADTQVTPPQRPVPQSTKFGITQRYPEYQKSQYTASHESGRGRVWKLNSAGKLEPVFVQTGVTDGRYTEVTSNDLKPGDQLVLGVSSNSESAADQARSPLTGQGGGRGPMGGMR